MIIFQSYVSRHTSLYRLWRRLGASGSGRVVKLLLKHGDIHLEIVKLLLKHGADHANNDEASTNGHYGTVKLLLEHADVHTNALRWASNGGHYDWCQDPTSWRQEPEQEPEQEPDPEPDPD